MLNALVSWLASLPWGLYLLAAGVSLAVAEVVSVFERDPVRALRIWGAAFLLLLNAAMAVLLLALVRSFWPGGDSPWTALAVGLGLPTLVRSRFTVMKPLPGTAGSEGVEIRLDELYERLQRFCRGRIDLALAGQRVRLVGQAVDRLELAELERRLRLLLEGGLVVTASDKARPVRGPDPGAGGVQQGAEADAPGLRHPGPRWPPDAGGDAQRGQGQALSLRPWRRR